MRPAMHHLSISAFRADALFVSALQRGDHPNAREVRQAVAAAVEAFGQRGCAGRVAQEFGDHPETAVMRMRWARQAAGQAFGERGPSSACARTLARRPGTHLDPDRRAPRHHRRHRGTPLPQQAMINLTRIIRIMPKSRPH
jgi:hypothetical protein